MIFIKKYQIMRILEKNNDITDLYPSRINDKSSIIPRYDLIVYGNTKLQSITKFYKI